MSNTNISHILLLFLVGIIIFWIFESINQKQSERFQDSEIISRLNNEVDMLNQMPYHHVEESPKVPKLKTIPTINACPLKENDLQTDYYMTKYLLGNQTNNCPRPTQSIKDFNKDFFKFRDYTNGNSSMVYDSIDKIANLYLDGDLGEARRYPGMKIRDIFDQLTSGPNLYDRACVRVPQFDNTMQDGYNYSFYTGMYNNRDNWKYKNEKIINGGQIENNLYANDPEALKQFPVLTNT